MTSIDQKSPAAKDIENWLAAYVAKAMKIDLSEIDTRKTFEHYGMGSLEAVSLISELEDWLGRPLDATLMWDYPAIESLAQYLTTAARVN